MEPLLSPGVSVGIPAFNEARNIGRLLRALLKQKHEHFSLQEILVVCDGCSDDTAELARSVGHPKIRVIEHDQRLGQQARQNEIMKLYSGEILVFLEADTLPACADTLQKLVEPLLDASESAVTMALGFSRVVEPASYLERILYYGTKLKQGIFSEWKSGLNLYACHGHSGRALTRAFTERLLLPIDVPEDAYMYLFLRKCGGELRRAPGAYFYARNVSTFSDRKKQVGKYLSGKQALTKYFGADELKKEYSIPTGVVFRHIFKEALLNPFWTSAYLFELLFNRLCSGRKSVNQRLPEPYYSSKDLRAPHQLRRGSGPTSEDSLLTK